MAISIMNGATTAGGYGVYNFDGGKGAVYSTASTIQTVCVYGTFGGATATHEISPDAGTTWIPIDVTNAYATANKAYNIEARSGATYRINVGGTPTTATSLSAKAFVN